MIYLAIDPGTAESAWVEYDADRDVPLGFGKEPNVVVRDLVKTSTADTLVVEQIQSYGMAVGQEVFTTVWWSGRFVEAWPRGYQMLARRDVKLHLCNSARAKDANVRRALLDRWGGDGAKGTKANPGPLYGVSGDVWAALGVAVTAAELGGTR